MKIKDGRKDSTGDFWYDLTDGGYLRPEDMLENQADAARVRDALDTLSEFKAACEEQIEGFIQ